MGQRSILLQQQTENMTKQQVNINYEKIKKKTLYFCILRYFLARCREIIMLAIFLIMQFELNAILSELFDFGESKLIAS